MTTKDFIAAEERREYPPNPDQLAALRRLFDELTLPVSEVAELICRPVRAEEQGNALHPERRATYKTAAIVRTFCNAAKQVPAHHDRLIALLIELDRSADSLGFARATIDFNQELTEFAMDFVQPAETDPTRDQQRQEWININTCLAHLSLYRIEELDQRRRAGWIIRRALEKTPWEVFIHPDLDELIELGLQYGRNQELFDYEIRSRDIRTLDYWTPAAAVWFKTDARGIWEMEGPLRSEWDWDPSIWKGPKGWSRARFSFWRERFEWIARVTVLRQDTKDDALQAARIMRQIEEEPPLQHNAEGTQ